MARDIKQAINRLKNMGGKRLGKEILGGIGAFKRAVYTKETRKLCIMTKTEHML